MINTQINKESAKNISDGLSKLLAETYTLYLKTHKYHWNVTGKMFSVLHNMFEEQYRFLANEVDDLAERIRVLGFMAPGSYTEFNQLSDVKEDTQLEQSADNMIKNLLNDHEQVTRTAKDILPHLDKANDEGTNSLLGAIIEYHEKTAWMLHSTLQD